jgi:hypothetical protein
VPKEELEFVSSWMEEYAGHMTHHEASLIMRVYGLHATRMRPVQTRFWFLVMGNVMPFQGITCKWDLKGSRSGRRARTTQEAEEQVGHAADRTLLDQDYTEDVKLGRGVVLKEEDKRGLMQQLLQDVQFLAARGVMDYSMFVGGLAPLRLACPHSAGMTPRMPGRPV